jgi:hypothetical protein
MKQVFEPVVRIGIHMRVYSVNDLGVGQFLISPENPIPNRENVPVIAIGIRQKIMVVYLVAYRATR